MAETGAAAAPACQSFAQLSDPHLTDLAGVPLSQLLSKRLLGYISWRRKRRAEHQRTVLDALRADLHTLDLAQLLITGDLTHIGLPQEFAQAAQWLQDLGEPQQLVVVPGNHDACVSAAWQDTFALWQPYMASDTDSGELFPSLRVRGNLAFIGLCSACPTPPLMASGVIGAPQLARLRQLLSSTAEQGLFRVVHLHHSPMPGVEKWRKSLRDASTLHATIEELGAELVVHGHGHRAQQHRITTPGGETLVLAVPSASALGLHGGDIAQYNHYSVTARADAWELQVQYRRYQPELKTFGAVDSRQWRIARTC